MASAPSGDPRLSRWALRSSDAGAAYADDATMEMPCWDSGGARLDQQIREGASFDAVTARLSEMSDQASAQGNEINALWLLRALEETPNLTPALAHDILSRLGALDRSFGSLRAVFADDAERLGTQVGTLPQVAGAAILGNESVDEQRARDMFRAGVQALLSMDAFERSSRVTFVFWCSFLLQFQRSAGDWDLRDYEGITKPLAEAVEKDSARTEDAYSTHLPLNIQSRLLLSRRDFPPGQFKDLIRAVPTLRDSALVVSHPDADTDVLRLVAAAGGGIRAADERMAAHPLVADDPELIEALMNKAAGEDDPLALTRILPQLLKLAQCEKRARAIWRRLCQVDGRAAVSFICDNRAIAQTLLDRKDVLLLFNHEDGDVRRLAILEIAPGIERGERLMGHELPADQERVGLGRRAP